MANIAEIGFRSDSSGLVAAEQALNKLPPAAQRAEAAAKSVGVSITAASQAATGLASATGNAVKAVAAASGSVNTNLKQQAANANNASNAAKGLSFEAKNLSFQLVDVAQGLLSGQRPFQIFAQQAGQIGQIIGTSKGGLAGLMGELTAAIGRVVTPARLAGAAIIGIGIGAATAVTAVIASSKAIDDLAKSTDQATSRLHALQQATSKKGISPEEFAIGFKSFSDEVYNAQRNMGDLNGLMIANGKTAKTNQQYFANVADLVANATSEMQKQKILEEARLPTTRAWVEFMSLGSKGIEAATQQTIKFNDSAEQNLIKKAKEFDDAWNSATTNMVNYFKSGIISIVGFLTTVKPPDWIGKIGLAMSAAVPVLNAAVAAYRAAKGIVDGFSEKGANFADRFGEFDTPGNASAMRAKMIQDASKNKNQPTTKAEAIARNAQDQQRIGLLGEMATVEEQVRQKELELAAAGLNGISVGEQRTAQIINATRATAEMNRVNQQAQLGIFNIDQAQKAANDTLQMWIDKGLVDVNNTQQMAAAQLVLARNIKQTADAAAVAAAPLQQLKQLELDSSNLTKVLDTGLTSGLQGLVSPMQDVLNGVTGLSQGFQNMGIIVLKAIQEMIIKMLILAPIAKGLQGIFGGFLGGGVGVGPTGPVLPSAKGNTFARGGAFTNKLFSQTTPFLFAGGSKFGIMGEAGPEAVMPLRRGPNGSLGVQMFGGSSRTANDNSQIVYAPQYTLGGNATQDDIARLRKEQNEDRKRFTQQVARSIQDIRKRSSGG